MSFRALATAPAAFVAAALLLLALAPAGVRPDVAHALVEVAKLAAFAGCAAAALAFDRGDYLRRAWALQGASYAILLARDVAFRHLALPPLLEPALVAVANACAVYGIWILARAWHVAGLQRPGSAVSRATVVGLALGAALLFAGPPLAIDVARALRGHGDYVAIASDLGDLLALPLLAPVSLTALALRGGTLRWAWGLLTASLLAWLLYDAVTTVPTVLQLDERPFRLIADCCRIAAGVAGGAAGLAQRRAVREFDHAV